MGYQKNLGYLYEQYAKQARVKYQMAYPYFPEDEVDSLLKEFRNILQGDAPLSMGYRVKEFEGAFSSYIGAKYAVGTNSCSAAKTQRLIDIAKK